MSFAVGRRAARKCALQYSLVLSVLLALAAGVVNADQVPAKNQALLLLRILAYDHHLAKRADPKVVTVIILYKPGSSESETVAKSMSTAFQDLARSMTVSSLPVQAMLIPYADKTFEADVSKVKGAALYLSSGLDDRLGAIAKVTRRRSLLSFSGVGDYISTISIALTVRDGKPAILVNLPASKEEGALLDAALLRVANVVRK